jgi:hypothetical protein
LASPPLKLVFKKANVVWGSLLFMMWHAISQNHYSIYCDNYSFGRKILLGSKKIRDVGCGGIWRRMRGKWAATGRNIM